jgi:hypothetical protein
MGVKCYSCKAYGLAIILNESELESIKKAIEKDSKWSNGMTFEEFYEFFKIKEFGLSDTQ